MKKIFADGVQRYDEIIIMKKRVMMFTYLQYLKKRLLLIPEEDGFISKAGGGMAFSLNIDSQILMN